MASPYSLEQHLKVFLPFSLEMAESSSYLHRAAFVRSFGRSIKLDDVGSSLAHKARVPDSWTTRRLTRENEFFVSCPLFEVVQAPRALGHIRGDGFSLVVNYWDQSRDCPPHKLKFKVKISLFDLPLICWNLETVACIVAAFGIPFHASHSSTYQLGRPHFL